MNKNLDELEETVFVGDLASSIACFLVIAFVLESHCEKDDRSDDGQESDFERLVRRLEMIVVTDTHSLEPINCRIELKQDCFGERRKLSNQREIAKNLPHVLPRESYDGRDCEAS